MAVWDKITSRGNVEDRRGMAPVVGGLGLTGVVLYLAVSYLTNGQIDVGELLTQLENSGITTQNHLTREEFEGLDSYEDFAATVLGSNNELWQAVFSNSGETYAPPKLVLFRTATESACGVATSQVGPHYCPLDQTIYLDETFFDELQNRFGAVGGDVAEAYVIAHEVGHHVQNQLGTLQKVQQTQEAEANTQSIKLELQADCFAGLWAYSIKDLGVFLPGEIEEAIDAAEAVGDDRIQERVSGYVNPESWTHGSSAQRKEWFNTGYEKGLFAACDIYVILRACLYKPV